MGLVDRERIKLITLQKKIGPALKQVDSEFRRITDGDSPLTVDICDHIRQGKSKRFRPTLLLLAAQEDEGGHGHRHPLPPVKNSLNRFNLAMQDHIGVVSQSFQGQRLQNRCGRRCHADQRTQ